MGKAFQISIPEMGTVKAQNKPWVILTSNRTRELGDALKRRCLYHWVEFPDFEKEIKIVQKHMPEVNYSLVAQLVQTVHAFRKEKLEKATGIAETLDWTRAVTTLGYETLSEDAIRQSLGCVLKSAQDIDKIRNDLKSIVHSM